MGLGDLSNIDVWLYEDPEVSEERRCEFVLYAVPLLINYPYQRLLSVLPPPSVGISFHSSGTSHVPTCLITLYIVSGARSAPFGHATAP